MSILDIRSRFDAGLLSKADYIEEMHSYHQQLFAYVELIKGGAIERIEIRDTGIIITTREPNIKLACDHHDRRTTPIEILNFGCLEPHEAETMKQVLTHGATIFDVGANIGWYSLLLSKWFPESQIWAFEPIPSTYETLKQNITLNGATNITANRLGLSDKEGTIRFFFSQSLSVNASMRKLSDEQDLQPVDCPVQTLDSFAAQNDLSVDFIKCDVEGAELLVLRGARDTIRRDHPIVFAEMLRKWSRAFDYHPNEIIDLLSRQGYVCFASGAEGLHRFSRMDENTVETNFFFFHTDHHNEIIEKLGAHEHGNGLQHDRIGSS